MELNDTDAEIGGTLFEDTRDNRRLWGQGDQDIAGFIRTMKSIGFDGPWGVEIVSTEHRALPVQDALRWAHDTAMDCFPEASQPQGWDILLAMKSFQESRDGRLTSGNNTPRAGPLMGTTESSRAYVGMLGEDV